MSAQAEMDGAPALPRTVPALEARGITVGYGPLYQGRFKSFPVERDEHLLTLLRYVERNALTAGLVRF